MHQKQRPSSLRSIHPHGAGVHAGSQTYWICVLAKRDANKIQGFGCLMTELQALANWLAACLVGTVAMESTGAYWIVWWFMFQILEPHAFEVKLTNVQPVKALLNLKSDVFADQWLQQLQSHSPFAEYFRRVA